jgi:mono/diheme cytochrome c family protein
MIWLLALACAPSQKKIDSFTRPVDQHDKVESTPEMVARGAYIANTIGVCGECHNGRPADFDYKTQPERFNEFSDMFGGATFVNGPMQIGIANITPDKQTGIGGWTDDEIRRAIRDGINHNGDKLLSFMPFMQYQYMSDNDVDALVAYLRSLQPVNKERGETKMSFVFKNMMLGQGHEPAQNVPDPDRSDPIAYGRYLVHLGHCGECHSAGFQWHGADDDPAYLTGSKIRFKEPTGKYPAPNLTPDKETGIGNYTPEDIVRSMRTGTRLDGQMLQPPMAPFAEAYGRMTDEDLNAIALYLFSLEPVNQKQKKRELNELGEQYAANRKKALDERIAKEAAEKQAAMDAAGAVGTPAGKARAKP